jgi:hypothetical protein
MIFGSLVEVRNLSSNERSPNLIIYLEKARKTAAYHRSVVILRREYIENASVIIESPGHSLESFVYLEELLD